MCRTGQWWMLSSLQSVPFFIFSESYGGKMAAAISLELTKVSLTAECYSLYSPDVGKSLCLACESASVGLCFLSCDFIWMFMVPVVGFLKKLDNVDQHCYINDLMAFFLITLRTNYILTEMKISISSWYYVFKLCLMSVQAIAQGTVKCNFAGVALGDSWISPLGQCQSVFVPAPQALYMFLI